MSAYCTKRKAMFLLGEDAFPKIYGPEEQKEISGMLDVIAPLQTAEDVARNPRILRDVEVLLSGWGAPVMDQAFLKEAPNLKAVFYGAGTVRSFVTEAFWDRGIVLTSSYAANAISVAEFVVSQIIFALKRGWAHVFAMRAAAGPVAQLPMPGAFGSTVGVISLGMIGSQVCRMLGQYDVNILAYDPLAGAQRLRELGAEAASLADIFARSDVVSLHAPALPETRGMISGAHFASMKQNAAFINTARGILVKEAEMIEALKRRPDLYAVLDVTDPEPPLPGSPLYTLPNVILTPHIAGAMDNECRRMGRYALDECRRWLKGEPLHWQITRELAARLA